MKLEELHPQFVVDENGARVAVILPLQTVEELLDELEDLGEVLKRLEEPTLSHGELLAGLREEGSILIRWKVSVRKVLKELDRRTLVQILRMVEGLKENPYPEGSRKLGGLENFYRISIDGYSVLYTVQPREKVVEVLYVECPPREEEENLSEDPDTQG